MADLVGGASWPAFQGVSFDRIGASIFKSRASVVVRTLLRVLKCLVGTATIRGQIIQWRHAKLLTMQHSMPAFGGR